VDTPPPKGTSPKGEYNFCDPFEMFEGGKCGAPIRRQFHAGVEKIGGGLFGDPLGGIFRKNLKNFRDFRNLMLGGVPEQSSMAIFRIVSEFFKLLKFMQNKIQNSKLQQLMVFKTRSADFLNGQLVYIVLYCIVMDCDFVKINHYILSAFSTVEI